MQFLYSLVLSLMFAGFWMWWYDRQDLYDKEPKRFLALIFLLSIPLSVLAGLFQYTIDQGTAKYSEHSGFVIGALFYLGVVAVTEELAKFFVVFTVAYPNRAFNEPVDGIIYGAAAALGFASFENLFYGLDHGPLVLLLRGPFSTLGHVLFSAMWGAALGLALQEPNRRKRTRLIAVGLALSILAHGVYDILVSLSVFRSGDGSEWWGASGIVFLCGLYFVVTRKITYALDISNFNPRNQARQAILLLRERRQKPQPPNQTPGLSAQADGPVQPRYAPNPDRYQFNGQPGQAGAASTTTIPATRDCPNCGAANLVEPVLDDCYNCGHDMQKEAR